MPIIPAGGITREELRDELKGLATKNDLKGLATKEDLESLEKAIDDRLTSFEENLLKTVGGLHGIQVELAGD